MWARWFASAFLLLATIPSTGCFCCRPFGCGHGHWCCYVDAAGIGLAADANPEINPIGSTPAASGLIRP
jgi:hypothetical protein